MRDGFIKVASATSFVSVADTATNCKNIIKQIEKAHIGGANVVVLPELCVTGYTCGDLFLSDTLLLGAKQALCEIAAFTADKYPLVIVGAPISYQSKLYNCAVFIHRGEILGIVPKSILPNYGEFYEKRYFASAYDLPSGYNAVNIGGDIIPINPKLIFQNSNVDNFRIGAEICEDLWGNDTPSRLLCSAGATIIANLSASSQVVCKADYRRRLVTSTSARLICGYIYSDVSSGESTQDAVYSSHLMIAERGKILAENPPFGENDIIFTEIDIDRISRERRRVTSYVSNITDGFTDIYFDQEPVETTLTRKVEKNPFVPENKADLSSRIEDILKIQAYGLKKRIEISFTKTVVIGISGGLDSCLALLAAVNTMDLMKRPRTDVIAVTMPAFGTTKRTRSNAEILCAELGVTFREINIEASVKQHFSDIGHDTSSLDVTYENAQARERTQVLMDIANQENGLVVGTGDLSELALGWATYNGDHMSMYGVNASIPKTLMRHIIKHVAENSTKTLACVLTDIVETPVSPELLPSDENGNIKQKTEYLVGPYELHDFFIYYTLRHGFSPSKIYRLACYALGCDYSDAEILKWLKIFFRRFFAQQFKRSCLPDGAKVGSISLSPRTDWRMPSDATAAIWLAELENL